MRFSKPAFLLLCLSGLLVRVLAQPVMSISSSGSNIVISATNGISGATNILLSAKNSLTPRAGWSSVATNIFDGNGNAAFTNGTFSNASRFFLLEQLPVASSNAPDLWIPTCGALFGTVVTNETASLVSQHEAQIGRQLDILRIYHTPGSWSQLSTSEKAYITAGRKLLMSVKPDAMWSNAVGVANGGSATVDAQMTSLAKSIAAVAPAKIMLIVWHEPENDVIGSVPNASAGTTGQYVLMWQNVRQIFASNGATNVIWCWDVENYAPLRYLLPSLWPGNSNVDWVMWDQYQSSSTDTYTNVLQDGYNWMTANSSPTTDYLSKPWGLAEWGVGINDYYPTVADQTNGIAGLTIALNQYTRFPKIKLVNYFDELAATLLPGAITTYSNFANSPYMRQQCAP
jgi:beta-mannanase